MKYPGLSLMKVPAGRKKCATDDDRKSGKCCLVTVILEKVTKILHRIEFRKAVSYVAALL